MDKAKIALIIAVITAICTQMGALFYRNSELNAENGKLQRETFLAKQEAALCAVAIDKQNEKISAYALVIEESEKIYEANLAELNIRGDQTRVQIIKELIRDPSCENELRLVKQHLAEFYE
ncbi:MAG: hypothetical protein LBH05_02465 [Deferribacteraceae bacterium]|jgi:Na+-translocating ferredoxin:NAD+ oxidoreductase RnfG subunit|nr:hypothetical protein [Deferribacteraceae bacterium]